MADIKKSVEVNVKGKGVKKTTQELNNLNDAINKADKGNKAHSKSSRTLDRNLKGNAKMSSNASKNFSKQAQSMQGILVPAYAEVAARVFALTAAYNALNRAAQFGVLMKGQQAFAAQTGKNMAAIARSLQEASGYMLDFQQASSSTALGTTAGLTQKTLLRMTKGARAASVALGIDMTNAMDRLTRGIVKAEPEILDELGVIIRLDKVYQDFAFSVGKTTAQLTEQEKQTARSTAILGQLEGKFGAIGDQVEANPFAKLAASVTDLVSAFGAGATDFIGPFISRLAESTELLIGLMAMVVRSLAGKVLPVFADMDKKLGSMVGRLKAFQENSRKIRIQRMESAGNRLGVLREEQATKLTDFFKLLGTTGGNALQESIRKNGKTMEGIFSKSASRGFAAAMRGARADIAKQQAAGVADPTARTPAFFGMNLGQLNMLESLRTSLRGIGKDISSIGKATKGSMVIDFMNLFQGATTKAAEGVAGMTANLAKGAKLFTEYREKGYGAIATLKQIASHSNKLVTVGAAAAASLSAMSRALNAIVGFFAIKMTVTWIAEEALNMSDAFSKASKALDGLNSDLEETIGLLQERGAKRFDPGMTIADSLNSSQAIASIADGLYTAMEKAAVRLDEKQLDDALLGSWYDNFLDIFGAGITSKLEEAISRGLVSMSANMKPEVWKDFKEEFDIRDQLAESLDVSSWKEFTASAGLGLTAAVATGAGAVTAASGGIAAPLAAAAVAITAAIESLNYFREGWSKVGLTSEDAADSIIKTLDDVNEGTLTVGMAVDELQRLMEFEDRETAIAYYRDLTSASKLYAETTKATADAIKGLNDASNKLMKAQTAFSRGLVTGGDLKDFADAAKATREALGSTEVKNYIKFRELSDKGFFGPGYSKMAAADRARFTGLEEAVNLEKKNLADIQSQVFKDLKEKERLKKESQNRINALEEELIKEQTRIYQQEWEKAYEEVRKASGLKGPLSPAQMAKMDTLTARRLTSKLVGGDVEKQYENELKLATRTAHITQTIAENQKFGNSALKENAALQQNILKLERDKLIGRRELGKLSGVELENLNSQIAVLDRQIAEAGRTSVAASKWSNELAGTVETLTQKLRALEADSTNLTLFNTTKLDMIKRDFNALKNSITENFDEAQQLNVTLSVLDEATKSGMLSTAAGKRILKQWLLLYTAQGKVIYDRNKQITEELVLLGVQERHAGEQEDLLDYRLKAAKIDLDTTNSLLRIDKERLKIREAYLTLADLEVQRRDAAMRDSLQDYKDAIENIAEAFGSAISESVQDFILDRDPGTDWRTMLAESFAKGSGDMIAGMFQRGVFGNQGLLSKAAGGIFDLDQKELDFLFPKTELEVIDSGLQGIKAVIAEQHETIKKIEAHTGKTAEVMITDWTPAKIEEYFGPKGKWRNKGPKENLDELLFLPNQYDEVMQGARYNITPAHMVASTGDISNMPWAQRTIAGGLDPAVQQTLTEIDQHVKQSQEFLDALAVKTIDSLDTLVMTDIGAPLDEAADSLNQFMEFVDDKFTPLVEGLTEKMLPLLDEATTLVVKVNSMLGISSPKGITPSTDKVPTFGPNISKIFEESSNFANSISPEAFAGASVVSLDKNFEAKRLARQEKLYQEFLNKKRVEDFVSKHHGEKGTLKRKLLGDTVQQQYSGKEKAIKGVFDQFDRLKSMDFSKLTKLLGTITTFVSGMWPKDLADSTLSSNPGIQTFLENFEESGALKVLEQNPDAQKDSTDASGGILVQNPTGDATALAVQSSLQDTLASNLHAQIMNDNLNARALITNSVASVGSDLMSDVIKEGIGLLLPWANGGVAKGGFRAFANGGTVNSPTLGLVGEGRYNEAIVPLPDGKSIPVIGSTGGTNNVTVNVSVDSNGQANAQAEGQGNMQELGYQISQVVQEEIMRQQRPGGLLNTAGTRSY